MSARRLLGWVLLVAALVVIGCSIFVFYRQSRAPAANSSSSTTAGGSASAGARRYTYKTTNLKLSSRTIKLDIADTPEKQQLGLGGRNGMAEDRGMVFPSAQPQQLCFWMKDMQFPIDILWLSSDKTVLHIELSLSPDTYPQTYCPDAPAQYVVELTAGMSEKAGVHEGDRLSFDL